ncbi:PqiC family protein [Paludibacterium yongneupense]|uniref:PqiC family protein n=1 Tax=Paludibacterium yongneupense TaxID=400061 RepID=UPI000406530A|nr:PqiC family protein [Paludibacterium yongneupense]
MIARRLVIAAALAVAGCASAPIRYYTLTPPGAGQSGPIRQIELATPRVPEGLQRPQLVLRRSATRLDVVETARWTTSFDMELQAALAYGLATELPAGNGTLPALRVASALRQFDARPGVGVDAQFEWTVSDGDAHWSCQRRLSQPASGDTDSLVFGMQTLVRDAAHQIALSIRQRHCPSL